MAEQLLPGAWWLHGTRGSNVFLVEAADGRLALVDTGFPSSAGAVAREVERAAPGRPLAAILLTHRHLDHAGGAARLREQTGASVVAGRGDCLEEGGGWALHPHLGRSHLARHLFPHRAAAAVPVDVSVTGESEVLPGIAAVPVPGHTPGSICYVASHLGAAFVGDLVISHGGELTRPLRQSNVDDEQYLQSLARFAERAPGAGLPGHGQPVLSGFDSALRALAALPRRRGGVAERVTRARRLVSFTLGLSRKR